MLVNVIRVFKSTLHTAFNSSDKRAKIQDGDFIAGLLQAMATAKGNFTLVTLRMAVCGFLETAIGSSAFNERLTTGSLVKDLQLTLESLMATTFTDNQNPKATALLKRLGVDEIIGVDASMVSLWDGLCNHFKGTFMNSAVKLHLSVNLLTGTMKWFNITPGATHDSKCFTKISAGKLYIFDLGYWSYKQLQNIVESNAFYLSRVKSSAKLTVSEVVHGMGKGIIGKDLLSFPILNRRAKVIELVATKNIEGIDVSFRVLGFWNKKTRIYHWYVTNLKSPKSDIYSLYRLRWQIELSFKAMKSTLNFDKMPTLNKNTVVSFTMITLINYILTTIIRAEAKEKAIQGNHPRADSDSILRAATVFCENAKEIYKSVLLGRRFTKACQHRLMKKVLSFLKDVFDPNYKTRKTTAGALLEG